MTTSTTLQKLRAGTTKTLELPELTADLREAGQIGTEDRVLVQLRRVRSNEVIAEAGTTPLVFAMLNSRKDGESQQELMRRMTEQLEDNPAASSELQQQAINTEVAIVRLGVTAIAIAAEGTRPVWEPLDFDDDDGDATVDILGRSYARVHNAIVEFAGLPYQRLGGAGVEAFPEQPTGPDSEPSSDVLRDDPEPVPG